MDIMIKFDKQKAHEIILYFANRCKVHDFYNILKYLYLADKLHLEKYGRFISSDFHVAMDWGPVPSTTYNIIKNVRDGKDNSFDFKINRHKVNPLRDANSDFLSESDIECMDIIISKYGNCGFKKIHDESIDDAYNKHHKKGTSKRIPLEDIIKTLPNSNELLEYINVNYG